MSIVDVGSKADIVFNEGSSFKYGKYVSMDSFHRLMWIREDSTLQTLEYK